MSRNRTALVALAALTIFTTLAAVAHAAANPPGDIPDNQAYVSYRGSGYSLKTPEGWSRRQAGSTTSFSDKYNSIAVETGRSAKAPTAASVMRTDVARLKATQTHFVLVRISAVTRPAGSVIVVSYRAESAANPVTGKAITNDVERYAFWKAGRRATLTLQGPRGSDNVDPWKIVTNSFRWAS